MIEIKNLTKEYEGKKIVDDLTLKIKQGSIYGFLGPNGAGKTTTVKMIVGISKANSGTIKMEEKKLDRAIIGYMPEDPYFYDQLNANEFLLFVSNLFANRKTLEISQVLEMVGLKDVGDKKISDFSKGMKQRLGLAQAIINDPLYLFLDEPLDGLDPIGRLEFKDILLGLKKQGKTIFFNSHILSDVEEICDEIGILHQGRLVYSGPVKKFCGNNNLEKEFVKAISKSEKDHND
jgi:ABC-2 type transport system ATP-binding protein